MTIPRIGVGIQEVAPGVLHSSGEETKDAVLASLELGVIEIQPGLALACSEDPSVLPESFQSLVDGILSVDMLDYTVRAFVLHQERCVALGGSMAQAMERARYWVLNRAAPRYSPPAICLSSAIPEWSRPFALLHEAFENAIALGGVTIAGRQVATEGSCAVATRFEITRAAKVLTTEQLLEHLRTREHMFTNLDRSVEFDGSLAIIRAVSAQLTL